MRRFIIKKIAFFILIICIFILLFNANLSFYNSNKRIDISINTEGQITNLNCQLGTSVYDVLNLLNINRNNKLLNYSLNYTLSNNDTIEISCGNYISINTDDITELEKLYGIGFKTAEKIINYRLLYGDFLYLEELKEVSGIGDKKYEIIKGKITI